MKNRDIYISALKLIGENEDVEINEDYAERAPYLLAAFCSDCSETEAAYREYKKIEASDDTDPVRLPLESEFPFVEKFSVAAAFYLAAMLIIDENAALSDKIYDRYCDLMARIQSEIPSRIEKIADRYGAY